MRSRKPTTFASNSRRLKLTDEDRSSISSCDDRTPASRSRTLATSTRRKFTDDSATDKALALATARASARSRAAAVTAFGPTRSDVVANRSPLLVTTTTSGRSSTMSTPRSNRSTNTTRANNASSNELTATSCSPARALTNDRNDDAPCTATGATFDVQSPSATTAPIASDDRIRAKDSRAPWVLVITIALNASAKPANTALSHSASTSIKFLREPSAPVVLASSLRLDEFAATAARSVSTRALSLDDVATAAINDAFAASNASSAARTACAADSASCALSATSADSSRASSSSCAVDSPSAATTRASSSRAVATSASSDAITPASIN